MNANKRKIINLIIIIFKKCCFYNDILIKKTTKVCYIEKDFIQQSKI